MKVGLFSSSLPCGARKPGGVDILVHRLGNQLVGRGHRVTMFSFSPAPGDARYDFVRLQPGRYAHEKLARLVLVPAKLNRLDTSDLEVLHLHGDDWFFSRRDLPTVRTFHGSAWHEARSATGLRRKLIQTLTFALEIRASRLATRSYTLAEGQDPVYRAAGALANGVDTPPDPEVVRSGPPMILFVGTWGGRKRGEMLYDAFRRHVLPRRPDAQLHMVSDACPVAPGVQWWSHPSDDQLAELYRRAWVFCLPSRYEGFGLPYAEAMAQGTPVVATDNPGAQIVLDGGRAGAIVSEDGLGETLTALLGDEARRRSLAQAGLARVQAFSWERVVDAHERAYADAIRLWHARSVARPASPAANSAAEPASGAEGGRSGER